MQTFIRILLVMGLLLGLGACKNRTLPRATPTPSQTPIVITTLPTATPSATQGTIIFVPTVTPTPSATPSVVISDTKTTTVTGSENQSPNTDLNHDRPAE